MVSTALELTADEPPVLWLHRSAQSVRAAVERHAVLFDDEGNRLGPDGEPAGPSTAEDLAAVSAAHAGMARKRGLPAPRLPSVASHVQMLSHIAKAGLQRLPISGGGGGDAGTDLVDSLRCYGCEILHLQCDGCSE